MVAGLASSICSCGDDLKVDINGKPVVVPPTLLPADYFVAGSVFSDDLLSLFEVQQTLGSVAVGDTVVFNDVDATSTDLSKENVTCRYFNRYLYSTDDTFTISVQLVPKSGITEESLKDSYNFVYGLSYGFISYVPTDSLYTALNKEIKLHSISNYSIKQNMADQEASLYEVLNQVAGTISKHTIVREPADSVANDTTKTAASARRFFREMY